MVSPTVTGFGTMVAVLTMAVVGGRGSAAGALIGALLLQHLPEWLRGLEVYYLVAYGALLLLTVILAPSGVIGLICQWAMPVSSPQQTEGPAATDGVAAHSRPPLNVTGLSRRYGGIQALDGVDLALGPGEVVGLVGANGSGKTTLLNLITGVDRPDTGTVRLGDRRIDGLAAHQRAQNGLSRSFQTPGLPPGLTPLEIVAAAAPPGDAESIRAEAYRLLQRAGLGPRAGTPVSALPAGALRRLDIARALATDPHFLLLDEPAAGLSPSEREAVARLIREARAEGRGVLIVEHSLSFLKPLADRLICLDEGRVLAEGRAEAVLADTAVRRRYLGGGGP